MRSLLCALSYFTCIPVRFSRWPDAREMRSSLAWLPLVGLLCGGIAALVWRLSLLVWNVPVATLMAMLVLFLFTGAMHEDGFCDSCDGLGVPGPRERVLAVLKDPQMGTFGTLGMVLLVAFRFAFWSTLDPSRWWCIPLTEALSRVTVPLWSWLRPYARPEGPSKASYLRSNENPVFFVWMIWLILVLAVLASAWASFGLCGLVMVVISVLCGGAPIVVYAKKIGGVTGDVLGASQQCALAGAWLVLSSRFCS